MNPELPIHEVNLEATQRRRKRATWWWVSLTLVAAAAVAVAVGNLCRDFYLTIICFNGVLALALSLRIAIPIFQELGRRDSVVEPMPFERWMPVQGRWLRILLATPGMLIVLTMFWATILTALMVVEWTIAWLIYELTAR